MSATRKTTRGRSSSKTTSRSGAGRSTTSRSTTRRTTMRRRTTRRRTTPKVATTIGSALGLLIVTALTRMTWPQRLGLVAVVLVAGLAYILWSNRAEIASAAAGSAAPSDPSTLAGLAVDGASAPGDDTCDGSPQDSPSSDSGPSDSGPSDAGSSDCSTDSSTSD